MTPSSDREREHSALRERLSRLSKASPRINASRELGTALQEVLDSGSGSGVITRFDDSAAVAAFLDSGMTPEEAEGVSAIASKGSSPVNEQAAQQVFPGGLGPESADCSSRETLCFQGFL